MGSLSPTLSFVLPAFMVFGLTLGCGARTEGRELDAGDAGEADDATDAGTAPDVRADTGLPDTGRPDVPRPATCTGERVSDTPGGQVTGFFAEETTIEFDFEYVAAGIEARDYKCPGFFFRAGDSPTFDGNYLELYASYPNEEGLYEPGLVTGYLTVYWEGTAFSEEVQIDVLRADGLLESEIPFEERRASLRVSHHHAIHDLEIIATDVAYCNDFPQCI